MGLEDVYLVGYLRSAFSRVSRKEPQGDAYYPLRPEELAGVVALKLLGKLGLNPSDVEDLLVGCALQTGEQWLYGGRHVVFAAGLPVEVPSVAVDRQCASSLTTVVMGGLEVSSGMVDLVVAGGVEHMSRSPMYGNQHIIPNPRFLEDERYSVYDLKTGYIMGLTAEKLAAEAGIGRGAMDEFSLRSHRLAHSARLAGYFEEEILPIDVANGNGSQRVERDLSVRDDTSIEKLASLPPAFKPDGVITAGNSSPLNSGASFVALASKQAVQRLGVKPMARLKSFGFAGVPPAVMGKGPVPASKKALEKAGLKVSDIGRWEINEAFAAVVLYAVSQLGLELDRVNTRGGAIAIGHPLGASGARLIGTLARQLIVDGLDYGVATLCVGGGQGAAVVLERV
ncbi:acetyl-CoA acetyltransferase [Candidatus Marsarchaeota G2 archaeon OSP_D]|jgi:acetyl-CoA acetyltransferase family protein|uniref:Acetyl-CoA acetyltransferase n=5 Tax=Candidatus Marsarchaeota group 2 TaxID=2203771 RepID=A0A2R6B7Q0_9ARCH|nr:MAG: acetyl-CoA acetyltransferase [Candidatus Marsarchaeota G2 archaeon OSP_D]PSN94661.1 MAG: acetyl-CoA acetyltransferase [Candidatus Marsarchaeota G2 archaeon ECH_B_2]PSO01465.1 MAG: acetyl-CoA acetyltransferase [Candidatus Marsarchaeota G2 archaeon ECH_B_1]